MKPNRSRRGLIDQLKARRSPKRRHSGVVIWPLDPNGTGFAPMPQEWVEAAMPPGQKYILVPPIMGVDEWNAHAGPRQAALVADARSDLEASLAEQRPDGEAPQNWQVPHVYRRQ